MQFNILAVDSRQQVVALNLDAASEALAADQARARGLTPVSIEKSGMRLPSLTPKKKFPAVLFSMELLSLLEAGLNLVEALQTLAEKEAGGGNSGERKEVLSAILAAILRHDPDRIMVGEIRDPETAEIAVQSALTGHLVYTTVHANNAIDVLGRFQHMGVDSYNTGFKGRKAIGELLVLNDELRELIAARAAGTVPLRDAAMALVQAGETTLEEINRVTFVA